MAAAVTGWAFRTPLGNTTDEIMARLLAGERAATDHHRFSTSTYPCRLCAPILAEPAPTRHRRFVRRMGLFGIEVGKQALEASGVRPGPRLGVFCGVGGLRASWDELLPALTDQSPDGRGFWANGMKRLHPFWMLQYLSNNAQALLSADVGATGEGMTFGGATAGAEALSSASRALASDAVDAALVVAYDCLVEPETLVELGETGMATRGELRRLSAPYSGDADGFVPGEAAAALVLQSPQRVKRPLALVQSSSIADGSALDVRAGTLRHLAARLAGSPGIVDGASRGHRDLDRQERAELAGVVDPSTPLMASAAATGEVGCAKPLLQTIILAECMRRGVLAPIAGLEASDPGPLRPVLSAEKTRARTALGIATGAPGLAAGVHVELP